MSAICAQNSGWNFRNRADLGFNLKNARYLLFCYSKVVVVQLLPFLPLPVKK